MVYYDELVEMYVGDDVFLDFYVWVFLKYDYVVVGIGIMKVNKVCIKDLQVGICIRVVKKLEGGEIIKVEVYFIFEYFWFWWVVG